VSKTQHAKFDELRDEREYYRKYLPTTNEQIQKLHYEIDELNQASKSMIVDKQQIQQIRSQYEMRNNQSVMIEKSVAQELEEQELLKRRNDQLRRTLAENNPQLESNIGRTDLSQHPMNNDQGVFGNHQFVNSMHPGQILPNNINDISRHSNVSGYGGQQQMMQPPRLSNPGNARNSQYSNQGGYGGQNMNQMQQPPNLRQSNVSYQSVGNNNNQSNNFARQNNPQKVSGGGNNPLMFNYSKASNYH